MGPRHPRRAVEWDRRNHFKAEPTAFVSITKQRVKKRLSNLSGKNT